MSKFHQLNVADIKKETEDTVSIAFEVPEDLKKDFEFTSGQYVTVKTLIDGEDIRRSYSICSCPEDHELRVAVKKVDGGRFSTFANEKLKVGETLEVMTPMGNFIPEIDSKSAKSYLFIAAGSGITPVISIIRTILQHEVDSRITLIYGNKGKTSVIFHEKLESIKNQYLDRFTLVHIFSREQMESPLLNGRISGDKLDQLKGTLVSTETIDQAFICGPNEMIETSQQWLSNQGMKEDQIKIELFGTPDETSNLAANKKTVIEKEFEGDYSQVTIILDGKETSFELAAEGESVLDAAMKEGADVPFACKGAVCCTCRAQLVEGKVDMELNYSLTETEVQNGFILTCQSHPITEKVVINYDVS